MEPNQEMTLARLQIRSSFEGRKVTEVEGDTAGGKFEGVIVAFGKSMNPTFYTERSEQSALKVFHNAFIFMDHPDYEQQWLRPERSIKDAVGRILNPEVREVDGKRVLYGTYKISAAEEALRTKIKEGIITGVSINAYVQGWEDEDGVFNVERFADPELEDVYPPSADLVTYPAAGGYVASVLESKQGGQWVKKTAVEKAETHELEPETPLPEETDQEKERQMELEERIADLEAKLKASEDEKIASQERLNRANETRDMLPSIRESVSDLPTRAIERVVKHAESRINAYVANGGELSELTTSLEAFVSDEKEYVAEIAPSNAGVPNGFGAVGGGHQAQSASVEEKLKLANERLKIK